MILRAVFWVAVVAMMMPREPDIGFGAPDRNDDDFVTSLRSSAQASLARVMTELREENGGVQSDSARFVEGIVDLGRKTASEHATRKIAAAAKQHALGEAAANKFTLRAADSLP